MTRVSLLCGCWFVLVSLAAADDDAARWKELLSRPLLPPGTTLKQVQNFCERRVPRMPEVSTAAEWEQIAADLRERTLRDVVLRGEAAKWAAAETTVEWFDVIDAAPEYRIRKLRFEAVPGMFIPALLYEPKQLDGKVPVALHVNGHDSKGTAADYKQVRCINLAKRGMLVLNLEWVGMGQLRSDDFVHYRMNQLDLCGTSGLAPFYLSMKRGLDVLLQHEHADPTRVAVSGLSGGGWQTIFISGLDERVTLSNPVAGYSSFRTRAVVASDLGDSEQTPSDLATVVDYTHLTAMRAPRPTLLTNNDRDRCCFAAGNALPLLLEAARPIYRLYDDADNLWVHINHVPGSHNFEQDNREAYYRLIQAHFFPDDAGFSADEIECAKEVLSAEAVRVPLPDQNAGFNTLAKGLAVELQPRPGQPDTEPRTPRRLEEVIRYRPLSVTEMTPAELGQVGAARLMGLTIQLGEEWTVPVVAASSKSPPQRAVVLVCDGGRAAAHERIAELSKAGALVFAVDPFYFGESTIPQRDFLYGLLVAALGERPLGIQVAQLRAIVSGIRQQHPDLPIELHAVGRRLGLAATITAALEPEAVSGLTVEGGLTSLRQVIDENLEVREAPELFCFGLLKECDVPQIEALIAPRPIHKLPLAIVPTVR
jgi:hypothetical protein